MNNNAWVVAAKNLLEEKTCSNCRWVVHEHNSNDKCGKTPRPMLTKGDYQYWGVPDIRTCPLWERMWRDG